MWHLLRIAAPGCFGDILVVWSFNKFKMQFSVLCLLKYFVIQIFCNIFPKNLFLDIFILVKNQIIFPDNDMR